MGQESDKLSASKMSPAEMYYSGLAEVYLAELEDYQTPLLKILYAKGVLVEIESDLLKFLKNNEHNERSRQQEARIKILLDVITYFENSASTVKQMQFMLRKAAEDNFDLRKKLFEAEQKNKMLTDLINEE